VKAANALARTEFALSIGRFDLDALIRACFGLRARPAARPLVRERHSPAFLDEPMPDFEDTMPAARWPATPTSP
jgi:hypothetical protein